MVQTRSSATSLHSKSEKSYTRRSATSITQQKKKHRTHCTNRAFCPYTLRPRKRTWCSCQFCGQEVSVGSSSTPVNTQKQLDPYNEQIIAHGCPNFDECREMWMNSSAMGEGSISSGGYMSVDSGGSVERSTGRTTTPLAFLHARDREQARGSGTRRPTAANERAARMQWYHQFQRFMAERSRQTDKHDEITACIDEVEAMDVTELQKMRGGMALAEDSMRVVFLSWPYERKLTWLRSIDH